MAGDNHEGQLTLQATRKGTGWFVRGGVWGQQYPQRMEKSIWSEVQHSLLQLPNKVRLGLQLVWQLGRSRQEVLMHRSLTAPILPAGTGLPGRYGNKFSVVDGKRRNRLKLQQEQFLLEMGNSLPRAVEKSM